VGVVIDDIPFASSSIWGGGHLIPELDPSDIRARRGAARPTGHPVWRQHARRPAEIRHGGPSTEAFDGRVAVGGLGVEARTTMAGAPAARERSAGFRASPFVRAPSPEPIPVTSTTSGRVSDDVNEDGIRRRTPVGTVEGLSIRSISSSAPSRRRRSPMVPRIRRPVSAT
jgi:hypothetical protein